MSSPTCVFPAPPCIHQPRSSLNPLLLFFYGCFIMQTQLIKSLVIQCLSEISSPHSPPGGWGMLSFWAEGSNLLIIWFGSPGRLYPHMLPQSHLSSINLVVVERGCSDRQKGTGMALITQEILRVLELCARNGTKTTYVFLIINHSITLLNG